MPIVPPSSPLCWICGSAATTREHTTNGAIIRIVCGEPKPGSPWRYHDDWGGLNQQLQGLNSNLLKPHVDLCAVCNSTRTQAHDLAIEKFVRWLVNRKPRRVPGDVLRPSAIYPTRTRLEMLNLHLYFAKKFGSLITEALHRGTPIPLDVAEVSRAIMRGTSCPNLYLKFRRRRTDDPPIARTRPIERALGGRLFAVDWVHYYGPYAVELSYVENVLPNNPYRTYAWHPRFGLGGLKLLSINRPITIDA